MLYIISLIALFLVLHKLLTKVLHKNVFLEWKAHNTFFKKELKYQHIGIFLAGIFILYLFTFGLSEERKYVQAVNTNPQNIKGINISNNDGNIDLSSPAEEGCSYVYIKATEGATYEDAYMNDYYKECRKLGMKVGAYHYLVSTSTPEEQADNFYNMISKYDWDLIPMLDVEVKFEGLQDYIERFKKAFNKHCNLELGIYSYTSFINNNLNDADSEIYNMPLWEANYNGEPWKDVGNNKFKQLVGHQYSTRKHIGEYLGNFNGDINEFNEGCIIK